MLVKVWAAGVFASAASLSLPAAETAGSSRSGEIDAQPIAEALTVFSRQTGLHFVYVSAVVRNQSSHAVPAGLGPEAALRALLQGTGLEFEFLTSHMVRIVPASVAGTHASDRIPVPPGMGEVIITGSRIPVSPEVAASGPVQTITAHEVQLQGSHDAVDVISALPQMTTNSTADSSNHSSPDSTAGGITTVDLRGLGPQRTLVLINGRRLGPGDPNTANLNPAADLDQIPVAMIDRVEVLTGGASATYGPDAIAGVVNFILKEDLQGVQVDAQYGFDEHSQHNGSTEQLGREAGFGAPTGSRIDGMRRDVSVLAGTSFDSGAGQLTGYFSFHDQDPVPASARDYSACSVYSLNIFTGNAGDDARLCYGSTSSNRFMPLTGAGDSYSVVGNRFVPFPATGAVPPSYFNQGASWYSQRDDKRYLAGLQGHLELDPAARLFTELRFMDDDTHQETSPSGLFLASNTLTVDGSYAINCSNPLLSMQEASILCTPAQIAADRLRPGAESAALWIGRRNIEGGVRQSNFEHRSYRAVAGIDGALGTAWRYEFYGSWQYTSLLQDYRNFLSNSAISEALQVTTGAAGQPVCISGGRCVPYDIFTTGAVTAQQVAWLEKPLSDSGDSTEQIIEGSLTGELANLGLVLPRAHEGLTLNVGFQHRSESLRFVPDATEQPDDLSGFGIAAIPLNRRVSVNEGYLEVRAPLVQDIALVRELTMAAGYRFSGYSTAGTTNTWKFDVQYAPIEEARLRASIDRAVREPSLIELYAPLAFNFSATIVGDPCAPGGVGEEHATASLAECLHTGITAAQYGDGIGRAYGGTSTVPQCAGRCVIFTGGNPALQAEHADTWSAGVLLTPRVLENASVSVDYFHINLRGEIGSVPEGVTLQQCLTTGDPILCKEIVRAPSGSLSGSTVAGGGYILANAVNTGSALVSGIDLLLNYRTDLPPSWGALALTLNGNWLEHHVVTPYRSAPSYDCAGLFGGYCLNGSVNPSWRHNLRLAWELPPGLELSAQWRFIVRTAFDNNSSQPLLQNQEEVGYDALLAHIGSYSYLDLAMIWQSSSHLQWRLGVNNVFDRDPPVLPLDISGEAGQLNTFAVYDLLGRNVFLALRANF